MAKEGWTLGNKIAVFGVGVAILAIIVAVTVPEIRRIIGLDNSTPVPPTNADSIAGDWAGTIKGENDPFSTQVKLNIKAGCTISGVCGTVNAPQLACSGNIVLSEINAGTFTFIEQNMTGTGNCSSGGKEYLRLLPDGSLSWAFRLTLPSGQQISSNGALRHS